MRTEKHRLSLCLESPKHCILEQSRRNVGIDGAQSCRITRISTPIMRVVGRSSRSSKITTSAL